MPAAIAAAAALGKISDCPEKSTLSLKRDER
jgi:hypothetical protein